MRKECSDLVAEQPEPAGAEALEEHVAWALGAADRVVLAVSGGRDSMVMLEAVAHVAHDRVAAVATFDHGTGSHATAAADLVTGRTSALGLSVRRARAGGGLRSEAAWRAARWRFLRRVSAELAAPVATAHTADDQVETVLMRELRGAGARGLAALSAPGDVLRPLLSCSRAMVAAYASDRGVTWLEDPSNLSRAHLRNRVRLDLLPALRRADPMLPLGLLSIALRAGRLRRDIDAFIERELRPTVDAGTLSVARRHLSGYSATELAVLWPAMAARVGVALDRRGTHRVAEFTMTGVGGARIQLSGGYEVARHRDHFLLRRSSNPSNGDCVLRALGDGTVIRGWRFALDSGRRAGRGLWSAGLPEGTPLDVRCWRPGDRMIADGESVQRRIKGLLRDAGVDAASRREWPVVLADGEIVWVPGVRRGAAATVRSGGPVVRYRCERIDG